MKILLLGQTGMLGSQLYKSLMHRHWVEGMPPRWEFDELPRVLGLFRPDVVINCIGVIPQRSEDTQRMIAMNALFPHVLYDMVHPIGARLMNFSTDCIFDPTPYGHSKWLGEVQQPGCITLRTSFIGRSRNGAGLLEWLLKQKSGETIVGYAKAIFTGFTTLEMGRIVERVLQSRNEWAGIWNVASAPISKANLLRMLRNAYGLHVHVHDRQTGEDKSLHGQAFNEAFDYKPPTWPAMIEELAREYPL